MTMEKRLEHNLDTILWWLIRLIPLIGAVASYFGMNVNASVFGTFFSYFIFNYVNSAFTSLENLTGFAFPLMLKHYASYLVAVEFVHVIVDAILFILRFAHEMVQPDTWTPWNKR